ncbi:hypothetical protein QTO34_000254 [Cnephaeus nilssonii]|uniref:BZIP domain-containing protein n=1 Tax=Cnephaeus nilssonii TaxID=3371016 RepID=A0AA40IB84_CNENI|nr:hypothetical protein QTO34_000254 [Eptesicus nilssonii]
MPPAAWPRPQDCRLCPWLLQSWTAILPAMIHGQILDPSMTAGSLPGLGPLTGLPSSSLTAEEHWGHDHPFAVPGGKTEQEASTCEKRREKNKVVAAQCRNKKKEQTEFLQQESEWLELMNAELNTQMEELKQERQQLILMLNQHHPTCIIRTYRVKNPDSEGNPLLEQLEKK